MLEVRFLGEQRVAVDGRNITATVPPRALGLIAAFVLRPGEDQLRSGLAASFWPESTDEQALTNLRRELHNLRQKVPQFSECIASSGRMVRWDPADSVRCDVATFSGAAAAATNALADGDADGFVKEALAATDAYSGELLPTWTDEWLLEERSRLHRKCVRVLDGLLEHRTNVDDVQRLLSLAARRVELEPLEESGYRTLMTPS